MSDDGTSASFLWSVMETVTPGWGEWEVRARDSLISQGYTEYDWIPSSVIKDTFSNLGWNGDLKTDWKELFGTEPWNSDGDGLLPDWIYSLETLAKDPTGWLRSNLSKFIIGGAVGFASTSADLVYGSWQAVADAFRYVWSNSLVYGLGSVTGALQVTVDSINQGIVDASASAGAFEPVVFVALWTVVFVAAAYVVKRAIPVLLDLLGMVVGLP